MPSAPIDPHDVNRIVQVVADLSERLSPLIGSLSTLSALSEVPARATDEGTLLRSALENLLRNQDMWQGSVFLLRDGYLENAAGLSLNELMGGAPPPESPHITIRLKVGEGIMGIAAATGQLQHAHDCTSDARFKGGIPGMKTPGTIISAPLVHAGEVLGVVNVSHPKPRFFTLGQERLLSVYCNMVAVLLVANRAIQDRDGLINERTHELERANVELRELNERYRHLSLIDELTGLHNRRFFFESGPNEVERCNRNGNTVAAVLLDLDFFKQLNDSHGHSAGDRVLREMARSLRSFLRRSDILARFGGEEFILLLPETDEAGAVQMAERMRTAIAQLAVAHDNIVLRVTSSMGVATYRGRSATGSPSEILDRLIARSDQALYSAKRAGRNQVRVATDESSAVGKAS